MLDVLLSSCKDVYIALRIDSTSAAPFSLFETVQGTMLRLKQLAAKLHISVETERCETPYRFQSEELRWLNQHIFRNTLPFTGDAPHLHILEAQSPEEEQTMSVPRSGGCWRRILHCAAGMLPSCPTRCPIIRVFWKRQWNAMHCRIIWTKRNPCAIRRFWYICIHSWDCCKTQSRTRNCCCAWEKRV